MFKESVQVLWSVLQMVNIRQKRNLFQLCPQKLDVIFLLSIVLIVIRVWWTQFSFWNGFWPKFNVIIQPKHSCKYPQNKHFYLRYYFINIYGIAVFFLKIDLHSCWIRRHICCLLIRSKSTVAFWLVEIMGTFYHQTLANKMRLNVHRVEKRQNGCVSSNCVEGDFETKRHPFVVDKTLLIMNIFDHKDIFVAIDTH